MTYQHRKRVERYIQCALLETALVKWAWDHYAQNVSVTDELIMAQLCTKHQTLIHLHVAIASINFGLPWTHRLTHQNTLYVK